MPETIIENYLGKYALKLNPEFAIDKYLLQYGVWEEHISQYIQYFVQAGSVCVDVGANVGIHSIAMAHACGSNGKVFAFEPSTCTFPRLVDNINLNPTLKPMIVPEKLGLSNKSGNLKLFASGDLKGNAYMAEAMDSNLWNAGGPEDFELCIVATLDSYLPQGVKVDFMKIDVEGMEIDVLNGAQKTIARDQPVIVYETLVECFDNEKIKACESFLERLGYRFFCIHPKLGKLVSVRLPNLAEDTLAIHSSQIVKYGEIMFNAARFNFTSGYSADPLISEMEMTFIGLGVDEFTVGMKNPMQSDQSTFPAYFSDGNLIIEAEIMEKPVTFTLDMFENETDPTFACARSQVAGEVVTTSGTIPIEGRLTGGRLVNRHEAK